MFYIHQKVCPYHQLCNPCPVICVSTMVHLVFCTSDWKTISPFLSGGYLEAHFRFLLSLLPTENLAQVAALQPEHAKVPMTGVNGNGRPNPLCICIFTLQTGNPRDRPPIKVVRRAPLWSDPLYQGLHQRLLGPVMESNIKVLRPPSDLRHPSAPWTCTG